MKKYLLLASLGVLISQHASAVLITDPNDARSWQGATIGTFAQLYYGSDTLANRQLIVDNNLLDDGVFDTTGYIASTLIANSNGGGCLGYSTDLTGTGDYNYGCGVGPISTNANAIDNLWFQTDGAVGLTVFDLGFDATTAVVFNSIDHGPLPNEAIESTVYLSNDQITWTEAKVERVWLEGFMTNTDIKWDGFSYAVGTGTDATFRYASVIHGGPGALQHDGDNEINGILGAKKDYQPPVQVPEPANLALMFLGALGIFIHRLKFKA